MAQACIICNHSSRLEIDRALVAGKSLAGINREFGVSMNSLANHRDRHLSRQMIQAWEKKELMEGMNILGELEGLITRTKRILDEAERTKKYNTALSAIREARGSYELMSKIVYSMHQAKITELELERTKEQAGQQNDEAEVAEGLKILTMDELKVFNKLIQKVHTQNSSMNPLVLRNRQPKDDVSQNEGVYRRTKGRATPNTGKGDNGYYNQANAIETESYHEADVGESDLDGVKPVFGIPIAPNWKGLTRSYG